MSDTAERKIGRPPLEEDMGLLNTTVQKTTLQRMRRHVKRKGMTLAAFVRQAIEEKLEREGADD